MSEPAVVPVSSYHYVIVSEAADASDPLVGSATAMEPFLVALHRDLLKAVEGWCFVYVDGHRVLVSAPRQQFALRARDAQVLFGGAEQFSFADDGRFHTLKEA